MAALEFPTVHRPLSRRGHVVATSLLRLLTASFLGACHPGAFPGGCGPLSSELDALDEYLATHELCPADFVPDYERPDCITSARRCTSEQYGDVIILDRQGELEGSSSVYRESNGRRVYSNRDTEGEGSCAGRRPGSLSDCTDFVW
ncbi:MAG: hypothetical protein EP330_13840 [Deltaproteobacteria bacterium]|nr:MAG: hypothetical protein EP330_13840 [Deltaproteobacteria bacterium]